MSRLELSKVFVRDFLLTIFLFLPSSLDLSGLVHFSLGYLDSLGSCSVPFGQVHELLVGCVVILLGLDPGTQSFVMSSTSLL